MTTLKHKTVSGIKWVFATSMIQRVIAFGTTVILARILTPTDFGLFALAFVMIDGFSLFKSLGFDSALVRRKDDMALACNTAFFLIPAMGLILFGLLFFISPACARAFGNEDVTNIVRALAFVFVISCFGKVPQSILYRDMKFKTKSIAELTGHIIYSATALTLALNGFGVWSLVVAYILRNLVQITIEWIASGFRPTFEFDKEIAWDMFHFGKYVLGGGMLYFFHSNLDSIVIGKFLGVAMLGYYAIARNLADFLSRYFLTKVAQVMYPAYSKIQDDKKAVARVMLKAVRMISVIIFPFAFGVFLFSHDILLLVFGEKWLPATNVLKILVWVGLIRSIGSAIWPIFLAKGESKTNFLISSITVSIFFILVIPGSIYFKLEGAGMALLISNIISHLIGLFRIKKLLNIKILRIYSSMKLSFICSLIMLLCGICIQNITAGWLAQYNVLFSGSISFAIYFLAMHLFDRKLFGEMRGNFLGVKG